MRLIGTFETEKEAYTFYSFLLKEGIQNIYEPYVESPSTLKAYRVWVYAEEDLEKALVFVEEFKKHPDDPKFQVPSMTAEMAPPSARFEEISENEEKKWQTVPSRGPSRSPGRGGAKGFPPFQKLQVRPSLRGSSFVTLLIILLCTFLFFWNSQEESVLIKEQGIFAAELLETPLQHKLLFDDPTAFKAIEAFVATYPLKEVKQFKSLPPETLEALKKLENLPYWKGIYPFFQSVRKEGWKVASQIPLFEKIRQGELWRFFTPCLLHRDFLHILFNMVWVWILLRQVEIKLPKYKIFLLLITIGILSNTAQYLISGPNFVGFSGIIVGLAGFIWMRQRKAPWEGYPLQKGTLLFLFIFVLAMFALEIVLFVLRLTSSLQITPVVANTAHIVGGLTGIWLGSSRFFSRGRK